MASKLPADDIRSHFSDAMSEMYRLEVPLYQELITLVREVNNEVLTSNPELRKQLQKTGEINRLNIERHGAIRLGTAAELNGIRRLFAVMGMYPVGYYDLSIAGLPVHSTAFRPISKTSLNKNPFRIFTSLLRLELLEDRKLAQKAENILAKRQIITDRALELIQIAEKNDGLSKSQANEFVKEALETFRWHSEATVSSETYQQLLKAHSLVADIVSFRGPHINHLTPRTLNIDLAQKRMLDKNMPAKEIIEGPPKRELPILLRQTAFKALTENVSFTDGINSTHTARFGEIEQRGSALTPKGRELYDELLDTSSGEKQQSPDQYSRILEKTFKAFPNNHQRLKDEGLGFFEYHANPEITSAEPGNSIEALIETGALVYSTQTYEDFLPVSAAGIFHSNLDINAESKYANKANKENFEKALGSKVISEMALYKEVEEQSLRDALAVLKS